MYEKGYFWTDIVEITLLTDSKKGKVTKRLVIMGSPSGFVNKGVAFPLQPSN